MGYYNTERIDTSLDFKTYLFIIVTFALIGYVIY